MDRINSVNKQKYQTLEKINVQCPYTYITVKSFRFKKIHISLQGDFQILVKNKLKLTNRMTNYSDFYYDIYLPYDAQSFQIRN